MFRRLLLCLGICFLMGCGPAVVRARYPRLGTGSNESAFSNITVLVKSVDDNRQYYYVGVHFPLFFPKLKLWNYVPDEKISEIITKKLVNAFRATGFKVLDKYSVGQHYDLEVTGEVLRYFVTVNSILAGLYTDADVSLKIKVYDPVNDKVIFEDIVTKALCYYFTIRPEIINEAVDMVVARAVRSDTFIKNLSQWQAVKH